MAAYVLKSDRRVTRQVVDGKLRAFSGPQPEVFVEADWDLVNPVELEFAADQAAKASFVARTQDSRKVRYDELVGKGMSEVLARKVTKYSGD